MKNVLTALAKSVLISLELTAAASETDALAKSILISLELTAATSETDATIQDKIYGLALMILNEEMVDIMK